MVRRGYHDLEPLGGISDKGRDAIHVSKGQQTTIFAYSVREDWRAKLAEDAAKIKRHGHICDTLIFVTTSNISASQRDEAINRIATDYGWMLDLFGLERLRVLLDGEYPDIKSRYPQIFPKSILELMDQFRSDSLSPKIVFINYTSSDEPVASWLARRLASNGYGVWCDCTRHLCELPYPSDIEQALRTHIAAFISIESPDSQLDPLVIEQHTIAKNIEKSNARRLIISVTLRLPEARSRFPTSNSKPISFDNSWIPALNTVLERLNDLEVPKSVFNGNDLAAVFPPHKHYLVAEPEEIVSNCLSATRIPDLIWRWTSSRAIRSQEIGRMIPFWSFRQVSSNEFLSFQEPPRKRLEGVYWQEQKSFPWQELPTIDSIQTPSLVSELLRNALVVHCRTKGLRYCPITKLNYFPHDLVHSDKLAVKMPDRKASFVLAVGKRKLWRPTGEEPYNYHLAPEFRIKEVFGQMVALVHLRIRFTNVNGDPYQEKLALTRRKHLCRDWWNDAWVKRIIAVCQYLSEDGFIRIGEHNQVLEFAGTPLTFTSPVSIREKGLGS